MKKLFIICSVAVLLACSSTQDTARIQAVSQMMESTDYIFVAEMAIPMGSKSIFLTSPYTLKITKDSLISYLPYFGRAYVAPIDPTNGGIQFESVQFGYQETKKSEGWDIEIRPTDVSRKYHMLLEVNEIGNAFLSVMSSDRQMISFSGYVEQR